MFGAMSRPSLLSALVAAGVALSATNAEAGGFGIPEYGVRRTSMAAVVGRPDEPTCLFHNPAGLTLQKGWRVYVSGTGGLIQTEFRILAWDESDRFLGPPEADGYYPTVKPKRAYGAAPMIAVTGQINDKLVLGLGMYVGNAAGANFDRESYARYHLIDGYIVAPQAVLGAGYQVNDWLSVGATAGLLYMKLHGRRELFPVFMGTDLSPTAGTRPLLELEGSDIAPAWSAAVFGRPHPKVTFGATVLSRIDAELEGPVSVTFSDDAPQPGDSLQGRHRTNFLIPWSFLAGVNVDVHPNIEIGSEFRYWMYREYDEQLSKLNPRFLIISELRTQKNFKDSWQISGGARVHDLAGAPGLELMMGTHYDKTPAPPETLTLDQPTFDHIGLHSGVRYSVGRYRLGASYVHYWYDVPQVSNSITFPPANFKAQAANNILALSVEAQL